MDYDLYLSYSGRKTYLTCPKQYEFRYILKDQTKDDPKKSLFGSIIGKVFEWFYTRQTWTQCDPVASTLELIKPAIDCVFREKNFDPSCDPGFFTVLKQELNHFIPLGIEIIRKNSFLTPYSRAEEDLSVIYGNEKRGMTLKIGGRADFIHSQNRKEVWIIDGKGSKHREKYVDSEQLIWYAIQHYIKYHVVPTRLGFMFYCFPDDPIKWIAYDGDVLHASLNKTFEVAKKIKLKIFDAAPSENCNRCAYKNKCDDGIKYSANKRIESGGRITDSIFDLERIY